MKKFFLNYWGEMVMFLLFVIAGIVYFYNFIANAEAVTFFVFVMIYCSIIYHVGKWRGSGKK